MIGPVKVGWSSAISSSSSQYSWSRADMRVRTLVATTSDGGCWGCIHCCKTVTVTTEKDAEADRVEDGVADTTALTSLTWGEGQTLAPLIHENKTHQVILSRLSAHKSPFFGGFIVLNQSNVGLIKIDHLGKSDRLLFFFFCRFQQGYPPESSALAMRGRSRKSIQYTSHHLESINKKKERSKMSDRTKRNQEHKVLLKQNHYQKKEFWTVSYVNKSVSLH